MLDKVKNILKKKELTPEEEKIGAKKELMFYGIFFIVVTIFIVGGNLFSKPEENKIDNTGTKNNGTNIMNSQALKFLNEMNYNYDVVINISKDSSIFDATIRKENSKEIIVHNKNSYVHVDNDYYKIELEKDYKKVSNPNIYKGYDTTFLDIKNIQKIANKTYQIDQKEESDILTEVLKIKLTEVVKEYSFIKLINYEVTEDTDILVSIKYNTYGISEIKINFTDFYKLVDKKEYESVFYTMKFENIGKVDLSNLDNIKK